MSSAIKRTQIPATNSGSLVQNYLEFSVAPTEGDTITIGSDVYEFRTDNPPSGGTPGNIWVSTQAGDLSATVLNLTYAIAGYRPGTTQVVGPPGTTAVVAHEVEIGGGFSNPAKPGIMVFPSVSIPDGSIAPNLVPLATGPDYVGVTFGANLTSLDTWVAAGAFYGTGKTASTSTKISCSTESITAEMLAAGFAVFTYPYLISGAMVQILGREPFDDVVSYGNITVTAGSFGYVRITLAGGALPNLQDGETISIIVWN